MIVEPFYDRPTVGIYLYIDEDGNIQWDYFGSFDEANLIVIPTHNEEQWSREAWQSEAGDLLMDLTGDYHVEYPDDHFDELNDDELAHLVRTVRELIMHKAEGRLGEVPKSVNKWLKEEDEEDV